MQLHLIVMLCIALPLTPLNAADIYRWVDKNGRTQFSDLPPDKHKNTAKRIDSRKYELTEEQRREAEARLAKQKASAMKTETKIQVDPSAANDQTTTLGRQDIPPPAGKIDCATQYRLYHESIQCYAPYRNANGSIKVEAHSNCTPVTNPNPTCGPPK